MLFIGKSTENTHRSINSNENTNKEVYRLTYVSWFKNGIQYNWSDKADNAMSSSLKCATMEMW
jgi:hypothetical protein